LRRLRGDDATRLGACVQTLERLDPEADGELFEAVSAELRAWKEWAGIPRLPEREVPLERRSG
jgi:hypothetical protein